MKASYTGIIARKILLAFLALIIICASGALFVRQEISARLSSLAKKTSRANYDQARPEQVLLLLHKAEDDFQASLLNPSEQERLAYKTKISLAFREMDTILNKDSDAMKLSTTSNVLIKSLYRKKIDLSTKLYDLKHKFDSLLTIDAGLKTSSNGKLNQPISSLYTKDIKSATDTIEKASSKKKRGLFGRLKDAITNKNASSSTIVIRNKEKVNTHDLAAQKELNKANESYEKNLRQLQQRNLKLLSTQKELIALNEQIFSQLEHIINDLEKINYKIIDEFKKMTLRSYKESTELLNRLYLIAILLVFLFAALLILFITQLNDSELILRKEIDHSNAVTRQKTDLLNYMSHEIRNPLTSINGFLYMLSESNMSEKQVHLLDSIKASSDIVLRTLTDTLDIAKMENAVLEFNTEPFNPDYILRNAITSMEPGAIQKSLSIQYDFKGEKDALVLGDSFRLNQIMINLLSNAIKYTVKGSIMIDAELLKENYILQVNIHDTGVGISPEQQVNLFSKYYQTSASKGQIGTGLGLFLCKTLVEMQGGNIWVKSMPDVGTTFSFSIPYKSITHRKNRDDSSIVKQNAEYTATKLEGINVLAVDDNELILVHIEMIAQKWKMNFHRASNGKEALAVISENPINVVMTDIQMPQMGGLELLASIRELGHPLNQIPVIVMGGHYTEQDQIKDGFSGVIGKPFQESELAAQLEKVLQL